MACCKMPKVFALISLMIFLLDQKQTISSATLCIARLSVSSSDKDLQLMNHFHKNIKRQICQLLNSYMHCQYKGNAKVKVTELVFFAVESFNPRDLSCELSHC